MLASAAFIGSDTIQVLRTWLCLQQKKRNQISVITIGGTGSPKRSLVKRASNASSEFVSRSSEMPSGWLGPPFSHDERIQTMVWRDSRRSSCVPLRVRHGDLSCRLTHYHSIAASSFFGAPKFTLESTASMKDYEIRSLSGANRPDLDNEEYVQEIVDFTQLKDTTASPRRRHLSSRSKETLTIPRNFMNLTPIPEGSSTYSASEYSHHTRNASSANYEQARTSQLSPSSPKATFHDIPKARNTPSPKHSPSLMSFKPIFGHASVSASGLATIKPLRLQERSHGLSIYDLYARDRETRMINPPKPYGWI